MAIEAFYEGPAGCGKTTRLMTHLEELLIETPLADGQRVLALTFMNGARRRLDARLRNVAALSGRYDSATLDHFAWQVRRRWRLLGRTLGHGSAETTVDFDDACDKAGALLERPRVASWVAAGYPLVILDEAQDLVPERLRMVQALAASTRVVVAADEFQCLSQDLRPNPAVGWLEGACAPATLPGNHRTSDQALRDVACRLRSGGRLAVGEEGGFALRDGKATALACWLLGKALRTHRSQAVAIICPARPGFSEECIKKLAAGPVGKHPPVGPYVIEWERDDRSERDTLLAQLALTGPTTPAHAIAQLSRLGDCAPARSTAAWVERQRDVGGRDVLSAEEIRFRLDRAVSECRRHGRGKERRLAAMTVHQAKNREFDGVVVLWGFKISGDAEQKRRLLYNAVTRARSWCEVIVQSSKLLQQPPFA
jgi:hypothetical protein